MMDVPDPPLSLFSTREMDLVFCLPCQLECMAHFEWALLAALEENGLAAAGAADVLESLAAAAFVDIPRLLREAQSAGNLAIPFVRQLTEAAAQRSPAAAASVHLGATSQDILDTAMVLQMREAIELLRRDLTSMEAHLLVHVRNHSDTLLAGRTWLQQGPPITFGLRLAGVVEALRRHRERIEAAARRALVLQFGGAVGTLAALGDRASAISAALARRLDLPEPRLPWHTQRDSVAEVAAVLGLVTGTLGKFARDIALAMQTELAEVLEPEGEDRGVSSTMPHKRNPVASAIILAAAARVPPLVSTLITAMQQEQERGLGGWQTEWEVVPEVFRLTAAALARANEIAAGMEVQPERMRANLESSGGLAMSEAVSIALAEHLGRSRAHALLEHACHVALAQRRPLRAVLLATPEVCAHLSESQLDRLLDPRNYLGSTHQFIDRILGETDADR